VLIDQMRSDHARRERESAMATEVVDSDERMAGQWCQAAAALIEAAIPGFETGQRLQPELPGPPEPAISSGSRRPRPAAAGRRPGHATGDQADQRRGGAVLSRITSEVASST
jgi:hypothetical protein